MKAIAKKKKTNDPELNGMIYEIKVDIVAIKQELKMHRWILGFLLSLIAAIFIKVLFL